MTQNQNAPSLKRKWLAFILAGITIPILSCIGLVLIFNLNGHEFGVREFTLSIQGIFPVAIIFIICGPSVFFLGLKFLELTRISNLLSEKHLVFSGYICGYIITTLVFLVLPAIFGIGPTAHAIASYDQYPLIGAGVILALAVLFSGIVFMLTLVKGRNFT